MPMTCLNLTSFKYDCFKPVIHVMPKTYRKLTQQYNIRFGDNTSFYINETDLQSYSHDLTDKTMPWDFRKDNLPNHIRKSITLTAFIML